MAYKCTPEMAPARATAEGRGQCRTEDDPGGSNAPSTTSMIEADTVGDVQSGGLSRQQVIAQSAQHHRQVAEQNLGGGVVLAFAVAADHGDPPVGRGAFGIEVVDGLGMRGGVEGVGHRWSRAVRVAVAEDSTARPAAWGARRRRRLAIQSTEPA